MWIILGLVSCFFLGIYDISKKVSLNNNAVIPVLFLASASGALIFAPFLLASHAGWLQADSLFYIPPISLATHAYIFLKSMLVGSSWILAYYALKHLPLTIVTPIRATGPVWTLIGALLLYQEQYTSLQWLGIFIVLGFFYYFALAGQREGIDFKRNRWVYFIFLATLLGSCSTLYDKFLIARFSRMAVQAWFSIYMLPVFIPFVLFLWYPKRTKSTPFQWHGAIPLIGILLTVADFAYFYALTDPEALITILSVLRRTSVVISFALGALLFREKNIKRKALALIGIMAGVVLMVLGS